MNDLMPDKIFCPFYLAYFSFAKFSNHQNMF